MDLFGAEAVYDEDEGDDGDAFASLDPPEDSPPLTPRTNTLCLGHEALEEEFLRLYNEQRLPHTVILSGLEGIGKSTFAFRLARFLLSQESGGLFGGEPAPATSLTVSEQSPVFRQVASGAHPDFLGVEHKIDEVKGKKAASLDVEEVRKIVPFLRLSSSNGGWRVVLIDDADTMNRNAQNSILKILEEPPPKTIIILIAHRVGALIPTIRSRSRVYALKPLAPETFEKALRHAGQNGLGPAEMQSLYTLAEGSPGKALALLEEGGLDMLARVLGALAAWPQVKLSDLHLLAEDLARPGADAAFESFCKAVLWTAQSVALAQARGQDVPLPLRTPGIAAMMQGRGGAWFSDTEAALRDHLSKVLHANLERREAVLRCFAIWVS